MLGGWCLGLGVGAGRFGRVSVLGQVPEWVQVLGLGLGLVLGSGSVSVSVLGSVLPGHPSAPSRSLLVRFDRCLP